MIEHSGGTVDSKRRIKEAFIDGYLSATDAHGWGGDRPMNRAAAEAAWKAENVTHRSTPSRPPKGEDLMANLEASLAVTKATQTGR